jgi:hypothetical protein
MRLYELANYLSAQLQASLPALLIAAGLDPIVTWLVGDPFVAKSATDQLPLVSVSYGMPEAGADVRLTSIGQAQQYRYKFKVWLLIQYVGTAANLQEAEAYLGCVKVVLDGLLAHATSPEFKAGVTSGFGVDFLMVGGTAGVTFTAGTINWTCDGFIS